MQNLLFSLLLAATPAAALAHPTALPLVQDHHEQAAPFTAVRWNKETPAMPEVLVGGEWYGWIAIDDVQVEDIVAFCKKTWPRRWRKRVGEDLVEALVLDGKKVGSKVRLTLIDAQGGRVVKKGVAMTRTNRNLVRDSGDDGRPSVSLPRPSVDKDEYPKLSPFTAVVLREGAYHVQVSGDWYELISLAGVTAPEIRKYCDATYGSRSEKRFAEDLVEVLVGMGHDVGVRVDLGLKTAQGKLVESKGVAMTAENRRMVRNARNATDGASATGKSVERVAREHTTSIAPGLEARFRRLSKRTSSSSRPITREQAEEDLDQLEWLLEHTHSYAHLRGGDYRASLDAIRATLTDRTPVSELAIQLSKLIAELGDGHARVRGVEALMPRGNLPFLLTDTADGVAAFQPDRSGFVDPEHPYIVAMDGLPIDAWLRAASAITTRASTESERYRALRNLRLVNYVRHELGMSPSAEIEVELAAAGGVDRRKTTMALGRRKPIYGSWPKHETARQGGDIGYLRVPSMDSSPRFVQGLHDALAEFADTRGLIIDVRGNGGGSRDALRALLPYFLAPGAAPRVVNVGAYRLRPGEERGAPEGYLGNRFLYPRTSQRWSADELAAIDAVRTDFEPAWKLPDGFSDWHYMLIAPSADAAQRYSKPVIVLLDTGCFSATDIFLGGFAGVPGVTLMGTVSGGGSGRSQSSTLAHSGLSMRLSSMASFRADGSLYDGVGVQPDVVIQPAASDFLLVDGTDTVLDAALERLRR